MLKSFLGLSDELIRRFLEETKEAQISVEREDIEILSHVELMTFGFHQQFEHDKDKATVENVWSILANHKEIYPNGDHEEMIDILRHFFSHHMTLQAWIRLVEKYLSLPNSLRIYTLHQDGYFIEKASSIIKDRKQLYAQLLSKDSIIDCGGDALPFIKKEDQNYYFYNYTNGRRRVQPQTLDNLIKFPSHLIKEEEELLNKRNQWQLPSKREKVSRSKLELRLTDKPWEKWGLQMDSYTLENKELFSLHDKKHTRNWSKAQASFRLAPTKSVVKNLVYKDKTGIVGIVGAGKSTFLTMELFRLKELGAKTAVATINVVDALMLAYRLHLVGIKAVPLIGRSNTKKHLKDFIRKVKKEAGRSFEVNPLSQLSMEYVLRFFGGSCTAEVLAKCGESSSPPCLSIKKETDNGKVESYACPLFTKCGKYTIERELKDADVWIGTVSSFIHTKPLPLVNPLKMTYAQLAFEEMDVIFIDEADSIQEAADQAFMTENKIFGEPDAIFEKNFLHVSHFLDTRYDYSNSKYSQLWRYHSTEANRAQHLIYELIHESEYVRKKIRNRTFGIHQMMADITKGFFRVDSSAPLSNHPFFRLLKGIALEQLTNSQYMEEYRESIEKEIKQFIHKMHDMKLYDDLDFEELKELETDETQKLLSFLLKKIDKSTVELQSTSRTEYQDRLCFFRFFIYHLYFDFNFKKLITYKKNIELLFNQKISDISGIYQNVQRYLPFIPEAATGRRFQYFFKESKPILNGSIGTFRSYDYLGIGRNFLTDFSTLFQHVSHQRGPAMCFLSGTSFAEGSAHFHVDVPLDYLLESTAEKESKVHQFLYPVYHDGEPIFISGEQNIALKEFKLKLMAEKLIPKIKEELAVLNEEKRKVILVVNSYEQSIIVAKALEKFFSGKVKALSKETSEHDQHTVLRGEVEYFADLDADVLVVPLLSINRGYNILKPGEGTSLFGSIFFLVRPYVPADSIDHIIKMINGSVPYYIAAAKRKNYQFYDAVKYVRRRSNILLEHMLLEENEWSYLDDEERKAMSWYMFINVWQMIGRLLRGQTDARVYYVDAPFAWENAKRTGKKETLQTSMLRSWVSILEKESSNDEAKEKLYGEFLRGLKNLLKRGS